MDFSVPFLHGALLLLVLAGASLQGVSAIPGRVSGDPHFLGARGTRYDFTGDLATSFCLFTDSNVHINGFFDGHRTESGELHTWIRDFSILWKSSDGTTHEALLHSRRGKEEARGEQGYLTRVVVDGVETPLPLLAGDEVSAPGGFKLKLEQVREKADVLEKDVYSLNIEGMMLMGVSLLPEFKGLRETGDALVHFDLDIYNVQVTPEVHGVLGQTFRPGMSRFLRALQFQGMVQLLKGPILVDDGKSGAGFLDGSVKDYATSALNKADCKFAQAWNKE